MDLESLLFHSAPSALRPGAGKLLVAGPLLTESWFRRGVVLMLDSNEDDGLMGLVLNKPAPLTLADLMPGWDAGKRVTIFNGGPVDTDRMFMLHTLGDIIEGSQEILPGIFVGGNMRDIVSYIDSGGLISGRLRFFLGYSGWAAGQVDAEIKANAWALKQIDSASALFEGEGNAYWRREVKAMGENYRGWLSVPVNPNLN